MGGDGMSDLVKRLRDPRGHSPTSMDGYEHNAVGFRDKMCAEAADRIEQLERELGEDRSMMVGIANERDAAISARDEALRMFAAERALADSALKIVERAIDHYAENQASPNRKKESRDWQSMKFAALDIHSAISNAYRKARGL